jgi:hypothetical protein
MTSSERVEKTLKHIEPDRTPFFEYLLLPPIANRLLNRSFVDYAGDLDGWEKVVKVKGFKQALRQYAIDRLELALILGHDMLCVLPNPVPAEDDRKTSVFSENDEESTDDPVKRMIVRNAIYEQSLSCMPEEGFLVFDFIKEEMEKRDVDLPILTHACTHGIWTDVDLMQTMLLDPDVAHRHFSLATRRALYVVERFIKLGIRHICVGGDFAGNWPIISPESYRTFIIPEVRKVSRRIHEAGCYSINASDGNLWSVIDDYLLGCEVDGYIEIDMHAGMDLQRLKSVYGSRITFYGNMDCGNVLTFQTPDEIRKSTFECIEAGMGNGGHIFCASNAISESIPFVNYIAMANAYREYFNLPRLNLE